MNGDSMEEKVGYLKAKIEEQGDDLKFVREKVDYLSDLVQKKFTTAETIIKVVRFVGIVIVAVITFQFADIREWYNFFFK